MEVIVLVISVAAMAGIYFILKKEKPKASQTGKNLTKSSEVAKPLGIAKRFAMVNSYKVLQDVRIKIDDKTAEFDFVVVGAFGVLCVECYGYGGEIYGTEKDAQWVQIHKNEKVYFENPITKATKGVRAIREALFASKIKNTTVTSAVVFTNDKASIALPRTIEFYTTKTFKDHINKSIFIQDKNVDIEKTIDAIKSKLTDE